jgi:hypothetical protein
MQPKTKKERNLAVPKTSVQTPQHTKGPWRVFTAFTDLEIVTDRPTARETESLVQFKGQRNARADAQLMAAAPEFFEALAEQTEAAQAVIDAWAEGDLAAAVRWLDASIATALAAVAKATA